MDEIKEFIKNKRPKLSKQSVNTYASILNSLNKKIFDDEDFDEKNFENTDLIMEHLKTIPPNRRKTILSALVIITDSKPYRDQMLEDIHDYNKDQHTQEMNETQKQNWIHSDDIDKLMLVYKKNINNAYKNVLDENNINNDKDLQLIQNYIILCLLGGKYIPPRRSKDYVDFKISDIDRDQDNYMQGNTFVFNSYKTAKTYGQQIVEIPKELKTILNKWIKINPTNYLLFDSNRNQLTNVKLNQRLNKMFGGKKVGVNQLRHTFLTDKYQDTIDINKNLSDDMTKMGSSTIQQKIYIKRKSDLDDSD
jgi:hypothetical protein